jgi:hypothetical protein
MGQIAELFEARGTLPALSTTPLEGVEGRAEAPGWD